MVKQVKPLEPIEVKTVINKPLIKQVKPLEYKEVQHTEPIREIVKTNTEPRSKIEGGMKISNVLIIIGSVVIGFLVMNVIAFYQQLFLMIEAYGSFPPGEYVSEALFQLVTAPLITGVIIIGLGFGIQYNRSTKIELR